VATAAAQSNAAQRSELGTRCMHGRCDFTSNTSSAVSYVRKGTHAGLSPARSALGDRLV